MSDRRNPEPKHCDRQGPLLNEVRADALGWSQGIRALYDDVLQEQLPADFVTLLDRLGKA